MNIKDLVQAIDRQSFIKNENDLFCILKLSMNENEIVISSRSQEIGSSKENLYYDSYEGKPLELSFSGKYVSDDKKFGSGKFCSRSCANSRVCSDATKQKLKAKAEQFQLCNCKFCGREFSTNVAKNSHEHLCDQNPNKINNFGAKANHSNKLLKQYKTKDGTLLDITYKELYDYQITHPVCEICGKTIAESNHWQSKFAPKHLCVDHDHKTNRFRGMLCSVCNRQLGWYEANKDAIAAYLAKGDMI